MFDDYSTTLSIKSYPILNYCIEKQVFKLSSYMLKLEQFVAIAVAATNGTEQNFACIVQVVNIYFIMLP